MFSVLLMGVVMMWGARQSVVTVEGVVVEKTTREAVGFANVVLMTGDSVFVTGVMTDDEGRYSLQAPQGSYVLKVTFVGYRDAQRAVAAVGSSVSVPTIEMEEESMQLEGVVIQSQRPRTELKGDAVVTNISGSVLEHLGNAQDLLPKIPGIITRNGALEVIGRGTPQYYINGRRVLDLDELRSLMTEDIRSVEVINNPGAAYGGEVRAVVRIRTVRQQGEGFGFALTSQAQKYTRNNDFDPSWSVLDLNYRKGNVDFIGKVVYWDNHQYQYSNNRTEIYLDNGESLFDGIVHVRARYSGLNGRFGMNWQINDNHSVGFQVENTKRLSGQMTKKMEGDYSSSWQPSEYLLSTSERTNEAAGGWNGNLYYNGKADELEIDFNTDFQIEGEREAENISEQMTSGTEHFQTGTSNQTNVVASKLVLSYPVWKGKVQVGAEESLVKAWQRYEITKLTVPSADASLMENSIAGFTEYALALGQSQLVAGVRYEHVYFDYNDKIGSGSLTRRQNNWYPSASFSTQLGPVALAASLSGKTKRPEFWKLSNEIMYLSRYAYQTGDPTLKNEHFLDAGLNARWKCLTLSGMYERVSDPIMQWAHSYDDNGIVLMKYRNVDVPMRSVTAYLTANPVVGCWNPQYTVGIRKPFFALTLEDAREPSGMRTVDFGTPMYVAQLNNAFRFGHGWQCSLDYQFRSRMCEGNVFVATRCHLMDASVQKSLLKNDALTITLSMTDTLNRTVDNAIADFGRIIMTQDDDRMTQAVVLRASYHFNTATSKYKGTGAGQSVKERL